MKKLIDQISVFIACFAFLTVIGTTAVYAASEASEKSGKSEKSEKESKSEKKDQSDKSDKSEKSEKSQAKADKDNAPKAADKDDDDKSGGKTFSGNVSWYGEPFHGRKSASGRIFDMNKCTSAHRTLPFFTKVLVENPRTGKTVVVEVIDRGPYVKKRVMDLSREGARRLGTLLGGVAYVDCTVIETK